MVPVERIYELIVVGVILELIKFVSGTAEIIVGLSIKCIIQKFMIRTIIC